MYDEKSELSLYFLFGLSFFLFFKQASKQASKLWNPKEEEDDDGRVETSIRGIAFGRVIEWVM